MVCMHKIPLVSSGKGTQVAQQENIHLRPWRADNTLLVGPAFSYHITFFLASIMGYVQQLYTDLDRITCVI